MSPPAATPAGRHVLFVSVSPWNLDNFRRPLIERLLADGVRISLAAPAQPYVWQHSVVFFSLRHLQPTGRNPLADLRALQELLALVRRLRPDLVLSFAAKPNVYAALAAAFHRIAIVPTLTGLGSTFIKNGFTQRLLRLLYRVALRRATRVVFHNADDARLAVAATLVPPEKVSVIRGSGVNPARFAPTPIPPREGALRVLFIGRLLRDKGIAELVRAVGRLRASGEAIHLTVVGDRQTGNPSRLRDEELTELRAFAGVDWCGYQTDVRPYLRACHLYALPSYREGLPMSSLEAMATGRPLLTTDVPGCRETVVPGRNGWLVTARSTAALETALREVLATDVDQLAAYGRYSRRMVLEHFSAERVVAAYAALWTPLLCRP